MQTLVEILRLLINDVNTLEHPVRDLITDEGEFIRVRVPTKQESMHFLHLKVSLLEIALDNELGNPGEFTPKDVEGALETLGFVPNVDMPRGTFAVWDGKMPTEPIIAE